MLTDIHYTATIPMPNGECIIEAGLSGNYNYSVHVYWNNSLVFKIEGLEKGESTERAKELALTHTPQTTESKGIEFLKLVAKFIKATK